MLRNRFAPRTAPMTAIFTAAAIATLATIAASASARMPHPPVDAQEAAPTTPASTHPADSPNSTKTEDASDAKDSLLASVDKPAISQHAIVVAGTPLDYRATAANMLMKDEAGKTKATIFFVAYDLLDTSVKADTDSDETDHPAASSGKKDAPSTPALAEKDAENRPITFVFNGGPGAASVWLHLGTAGPRAIRLAEDGFAPPPPYVLTDNPDTWLDKTDLVFIDPVGTGFSRPAEGEKTEQFYGVTEDVRSVGEFIRLYLTVYKRWSSPKFLAGESYGTTRAAALSEYLIDRHGIALNGIALISTVLNFQTLRFAEGNDLPYVLYLPSYAAVAWYHRKLPSHKAVEIEKLMNEVQDWALGDYAHALARGDTLTPQERDHIARKLSEYTGLPLDLILRNNLRIDSSRFQKHLLADQRKIVGRFDGRVTGFDLEPGVNWPMFDPSLSQYLPIYNSTFNDYVRRELKFQSTLPYETLSDRVRPWRYGEDGKGHLSVVGDLRSAMAKNPYLKVLVASSYYDLATPLFATTYTLNHLDIGLLRENIIERHYFGGHMMYHYQPSRAKLHGDMTTFIREASFHSIPHN